MKILRVAGCLLGLMVGVCAEASQFRAVAKESQALWVGPGERYPELPYSIQQGDVVLVLGNSTGGSWMNIMKSDGREGWISAKFLDLYKIPAYELDDLEEVWQRKRRVTSQWTIDLGALMASSPNSLGVGGTIWWIPFRNGLTAQKVDQFELGGGFRLGVRVRNNAASDGKMFAEMPFMMQWMFRMPPRGALMAGIRAGAALIQDSSRIETRPYTFVWGGAIRYFPYDHFGFYAELITAHRVRFFITRQAGVSFRF